MADEDTGFSLADIADLDVSDIAEVRFEQIPAGVYGWEVTEADLTEDEKDGERRFGAIFTLKILEVKTVIEQGVDKESLVGKTHTERFFVKPNEPQEDVQKAIGRIRAFIADVGGNNAGKLGEIVRGLKGHTFVSKGIKQKDRQDKTVEYFRLKPDPKKA